MKFPYGLSDFGTLIRSGFWYQDRTDRLPLIEDAGRQLIFLRPRRFGKSLLLSMLEHYYDLNRAGEFADLFGALAVGRTPTALHNRYFVMKWDFSLVKAQGGVRDIQAALHRHINDRIALFARYYSEQLTLPITIHPHNAISSFESVLAAVRATDYRIYLLVDEYDSFTNQLIMSGQAKNGATVLVGTPHPIPPPQGGRVAAVEPFAQEASPDLPEGDDGLQALLYGEGLLKTVFKAVKAAAGGLGLERVFITGVAPLVLSDLTSGYNVAEAVYLEPGFNDLCGFTEPEVVAVLERMATEMDGPADWTAPAALETMRTFYNGYRFSTRADAGLYNPTLCLYFLKSLQQHGAYPEPLLDENLGVDRGKLVYVSQLPRGDDLLVQALRADTDLMIPQLARRFGVADVIAAAKDQPFMASLLYFFGILTLGGQGVLGKLILRIPNLVARTLYVERLQDLWLPGYTERLEAQGAAEALYLKANPEPLCDFIEQRLFAALSNRDYRWTNELLVKFAFLSVLYNDRLHIAASEQETGRGYVDLSLIVRPDMRRFEALDLLFEFKYLPLGDLGLSGAEVRARSRESLAALPAVAAQLDAAAAQARDYGATLASRHGLTDLHAFAVVALGLERLIWRAL